MSSVVLLMSITTLTMARPQPLPFNPAIYLEVLSGPHTGFNVSVVIPTIETVEEAMIIVYVMEQLKHRNTLLFTVAVPSLYETLVI